MQHSREVSKFRLSADSIANHSFDPCEMWVSWSEPGYPVPKMLMEEYDVSCTWLYNT